MQRSQLGFLELINQAGEQRLLCLRFLRYRLTVDLFQFFIRASISRP